MSNAVAMVEKTLLGTLLVVPSLLERCSALSSSDFSDPFRGRVFDEIRVLGDFADAPMVAIGLESKGVAPPKGMGWASAMARLLDNYFVDDDAVDVYVQKIREAAMERRLDRRSRVK